MTVTQFDLKLANHVQDKGRIDLEACEALFGKSKSTLKRSLYSLNDYLPEHLHFSISNHGMKTNMTYADFLRLCKSISPQDYTASLDERYSLVICKAVLKGRVNVSNLYQEIGLSLSTKKKDRKELGRLLEEKGVQVINCHKLGIQLEGNERFLRMYVARKLISVVESTEGDQLVPRKANTPIQKILFNMFEEYLSEYHTEVIKNLSMFFGDNAKPLDYASKKFIYVFTAISLMRLEKGHSIKNILSGMPEVKKHYIFPTEEDSQYMDYLLASLNYKQLLEFPEDITVSLMTKNLIAAVETDKSIQFHTYKEFFDDLYAYLYKCLIKNKLDYYFYDDKLEDTKKVYPNLFCLIEKKVEGFKNQYSVELSEHQISVVCLIVERYIIKNRIVGMNNRKIIIITNSSIEKVNFFLEMLSQHVNFEMVSYLTINELYKLEDLTFDAILTFSNRITVLLAELGWRSIKLNFYLESSDIKTLLDNGFTSSRNNKLITEELINKLDRQSDKLTKIAYLKSAFPDIMI